MKDRVTHVGFNAGRFGTQGDLAALDRRIGEQMAMGATVCELAAVNLDAVSACRLIPSRVAALKEVLRRHPMRYTLHAPIAINLMDEPHYGLQCRAAEASLELAAECGASIAVFHPGRVHPATWADRAEQLLAAERDVLARLGDRGQSLGITIAYENMSPNRRIVANTEISYALDLAALARQLAALDHRAVVACLDVSHAQQGAVLCGYDLAEQARVLAPHVGHIHFSDSTGVPATIRWDDEGERLFFGIGDMHAPPSFGALDFAKLVPALTVRDGTAIVIELMPNHYDHSREAALADAWAFAARINAVNR